jgi:hypothetical protein
VAAARSVQTAAPRSIGRCSPWLRLSFVNHRQRQRTRRGAARRAACAVTLAA